jgi:hypothetical protein
MKKMKKFKQLVLMVLGIFLAPVISVAQDDFAVPDSLSMDQEFMADAMMRSNSTHTTIIIAIIVLVAAAVAYYIYTKRKSLKPGN